MKIGIRQHNTHLKRFFVRYPLTIGNYRIVNTLKEYRKKQNAAFFPFGAIEKKALFNELQKYNFSFPNELINIWLEFGGGELFQEENILYPLHSDDIVLETLPNHLQIVNEKGFDAEYQIFSTNLANYTAFHKKTQAVAFFLWHNNRYQVERHFANIIEWFEELWGNEFNINWLEVH